jgi:hypothetical protein
MPIGSMVWDEKVAWFDIERASIAFLENCGNHITLISIAVCNPHLRDVEAFFMVKHNPPIYSAIMMRCSAPSRIETVCAFMGERARFLAREWLR